MSIYKTEDDKLIELQHTTFEKEKIFEVKDLQKYISNSIEIIDSNLLVISTEYSNWEDSKRSIDILCVDSDANLVVIELKRTQDGGHMELQAIRYSTMISNMNFDEAVKAYSQYLNKIQSNDIDPEQKILEFLEWDTKLQDGFGKEVKIILVSADFSIELTTSILWLNDRDIDIKCIRVKPQKDKDCLYYDIQQIIPLPESADYQVRLKEKAAQERVVRRENKRAISVITKLFEMNKLVVGDKVLLKPALDQGHSREKVTAIIERKGRNCLKREGDSQFYSFSKLRTVLTKELALLDVKPEWGFRLKHDWINEKGINLADLAKEDINN